MYKLHLPPPLTGWTDSTSLHLLHAGQTQTPSTSSMLDRLHLPPPPPCWTGSTSLHLLQAQQTPPPSTPTNDIESTSDKLY